MSQLIKCPVEGCRHNCQNPKTLFTHLAAEHIKSEVIAALVREVVKSESEK